MVSRIRQKFKQLIDSRYKGWDITVALRYLPIVEDIRKHYKSNELILEVGSNESGITPYLKKRVTGVDLGFDKKLLNPLLNPVTGSATSLPFKDQSFDYCLTVDTLEHLPNNQRQQAIEELLRVCRKKAYLAFPAGRGAQKVDKEIDEFYLKLHGRRFPFLKEHLEYGLPDIEEIKKMLEGRSDFKIQIKKNTNLKLWKMLLRWGLSDQQLKSSLYRRALLLTPILRHINFGRTYRVLFILKRIRND